MTKTKCKWVNKRGGPCPWASLQDKNYCKRHSVYEGVYKPEDIPSLDKCPGCKNLYKNTTTNKSCTKCINRGKKSRNIAKKSKLTTKKCIHIKNNNKCRHNASNENDYCSKHQNYYKVLMLEKEGHRVCSNNIRGCFAILEDGDISRCKTCKNASNKKEKRLRDKKKSAAIKFNEENVAKVMCIKCNKIVDIKNIKNNKCIKCYDAYYKTQFNRKPKNLYSREISEHKNSANRRKIKWELSEEQTIKLISGSCYYCNYKSTIIGIDRLNSSKYYTLDNCVSSCKICNIMKSTHSVEDFRNIIIHLAMSMKLINYDKLYNHYKCEYSTLFEPRTTQSKTYESYCRENKVKRNVNIDFDSKYYNYLLSMPCYYCHNLFENGCRGIDRLNSSLHYTKNNSVPCCKTCNLLKNSLTLKEFQDKITFIYKFFVLKQDVAYTDSCSRLLLALTNDTEHKFTTFTQLRLMNQPSFYNNLIYNDNIDNNNLSNIKIQLEFIDKNSNSVQSNIWDYFRRYISSFKVLHTSKLVGRQIYILVKDSVSMKYLGILSLSSDYNNLSSRDKYIGWDTEEKYKKLINTMNISTCVSTQPFGFNYNGGKLLTALCFSKEVLSYYHEKYKDHLLGITTTSLYGKSIQYDRLPYIKFMGLTKGNSVHKISTSTVKLCKQIMKDDFNMDVTKYSKLHILMGCLRKLNIPREEYLTSNKKGVYFGYTHKNSKEYLCGNIHNEPNPINSAQTSDEIFKWWVNRWGNNRNNHLRKTNRLKKYEDCIKEITIQQ